MLVSGDSLSLEEKPRLSLPLEKKRPRGRKGTLIGIEEVRMVHPKTSESKKLTGLITCYLT